MGLVSNDPLFPAEQTTTYLTILMIKRPEDPSKGFRRKTLK